MLFAVVKFAGSTCRSALKTSVRVLYGACDAPSTTPAFFLMSATAAFGPMAACAGYGIV